MESNSSLKDKILKRGYHTAILCCLIMLVLSGLVFADETSDPDIPIEVTASFCQKDIYVNGIHYDNYYLENPVLLFEGKSYYPVKEGRLSIEKGIFCDLEDRIVLTGFHLEVGDIKTSLYDVLSFGDVLYYSEDLLEELGIADVEYDHIAGYYLSSDKDIPASIYALKNPNKAYIKGRTAYMMTHNWDITEEQALSYEYLFRHEANVREHVDEDLLIAVCRYESCFYERIGKNAVGLMQVLKKYALKKGYTEEQIYDPHVNIAYGATYIEDRLVYYNDDLGRALAAYNLGITKVPKTGEYDNSYAQKVRTFIKTMDSWLIGNGYSNTFEEYIEIE